MSGDGPNNLGTPVTSARDAAVEKGIVVNGLPILVLLSQTVQELDRYYAECVTGGPGSFVLPIRDTSGIRHGHPPQADFRLGHRPFRTGHPRAGDRAHRLPARRT